MANIPKNIIEILIKYIKDLSKEIEIDKVIIFGSYAKNCYNKDSDIDIAIFSKNFTDSTKIEDLSFLLIKTSGLGLDIQPQPFTLDDYLNPDGLVKEIIDTGFELKVA